MPALQGNPYRAAPLFRHPVITGCGTAVSPEITARQGVLDNLWKKGRGWTADRLAHTTREANGCNSSECIAHAEVDVMTGGRVHIDAV